MARTATLQSESRGPAGSRTTKTITPYLWFDNQAEEAAKFYTSIFEDSRILGIMRDEVGVGGPKGRAMTVTFQLLGQDFIALNGGPQFKFNEAISLFVSVDSQEEVDELWTRLTSGGGVESMCGWLKDKYGLSWQIIPRILGELLQDKNSKKAQAAMQAMLQMKKIDIKGLRRAHEAA
jgi:predicted 3-demethylubiquinone-9 3-methyltransferase (glyoxalase superfamily)